MKALKLIALAAFAMLFSQCKTTSPTGPVLSTALMSEVARTLDTIDSQLFIYADSTNGNDHAALERTGSWLKNRTNIQSVSVLDSSYLYFTLQSGLTGIYYLDEVNDSGMSLTRGGPGGGGTLVRWSTLSAHTLTNNSVLIFIPTYDEFYTDPEFQSVLNIFQNSGLGLNVTVVKDAQCTSDIVNKFGTYGFVIMDTHGLPNGFLIGTKVPDSLTTSEGGLKEYTNVNLGSTGYDNFQAGQILLARGLVLNVKTPGWQHVKRKIATDSFRVVLSSKYVSGMPSLSGTVVFGNFCYSGQSVPNPEAIGVSTPIQTAFSTLNPISYYGYALAGGTSTIVHNDFAKRVENYLLTQFITNTDSTGDCYLQPNGTEYFDLSSKGDLYFKHIGADNWSYMKCGDTLIDSRDGQKYTTVCIGKQKWMAQNLNYNAPGSYTYNNDPANGVVYGRLYDWATLMQGAASSNASPSGVQGVCPKGWHIPSNAEYVSMAGSLGGSILAGGAMKSTSSLWNSPNTGATNSSGFSGLPGGSGSDGSPATFSGIGDASQFATSQLTTNGNNAVIWFLNSSDGTTGETATPKTNANSCRCVKDP